MRRALGLEFNYYDLGFEACFFGRACSQSSLGGGGWGLGVQDCYEDNGRESVELVHTY